MPDSRADALNCEQIRNVIAQGRELTAMEAAHVDACDSCFEAWLAATVVQALEVKPEVRIPDNFASRVAARMQDERSASSGAMERRSTRTYQQHWGLVTACLFIAVGLTVVAFADPIGMNTRMGTVFIGLIAFEIAGIGLWLGIGYSGEGRR